MSYQLLTINQTKTLKSLKYGYITAILHLAPNTVASRKTVCKFASPGCKAICLNYSGRGRYSKVQMARIRKTLMFWQEKDQFMEFLRKDIQRFAKRAKRKNLKPCLRLDGTSDLGIAAEIAAEFPKIKFYDYTKDPERYQKFLDGRFPKNYHLTFSRSEINDDYVKDFLTKSGSVAIVFNKIPKVWNGYKVINGDNHDLRFKDRSWNKIRGSFVVGLKQKGSRKNHKGFVYHG